MNENMNKEQDGKSCPACDKCGKMCGHGMCCHGGHHHFWVRLIVGLIILAAAFCIGVKVGQFKGQFGYGYGGYMMRYPGTMRAYPAGFPINMMNQPTASTTPAR
jgi:hypothetical protein